MNAWIFDSGLFSNPYHFSKQHHKTKQYYYTFIQVSMACLLLSFIFQSHLFQKPSKSISLLCNTHLSAIPLSLYFCHSLQRSSHMVLFTHLAPSHFWKVAFKLQHRKPNYTRPIHTHVHTSYWSDEPDQLVLHSEDSQAICCYYLHLSISTE